MAKTIYEKIEEKGRLEANDILEEGKKKALAYVEAEINAANAKALKQKETAQSRNADLIKTETTSSEQAARQRILAVKKELIHKAFVAALDELKKLDDNKLKDYVINKIKNVSLKGDEVVKVNKADYSRFVKLFGEDLGKLNQQFNYNLTLSKESVDISGGFILINPSFDVDCSYEASIKALEGELETFIAGILFKE